VPPLESLELAYTSANSTKPATPKPVSYTLTTVEAKSVLDRTPTHEKPFNGNVDVVQALMDYLGGKL
jgi:hypothetical protein